MNPDSLVREMLQNQRELDAQLLAIAARRARPVGRPDRAGLLGRLRGRRPVTGAPRASTAGR